MNFKVLGEAEEILFLWRADIAQCMDEPPLKSFIHRLADSQSCQHNQQLCCD